MATTDELLSISIDHSSWSSLSTKQTFQPNPSDMPLLSQFGSSSNHAVPCTHDSSPFLNDFMLNSSQDIIDDDNATLNLEMSDCSSCCSELDLFSSPSLPSSTYEDLFSSPSPSPSPAPVSPALSITPNMSSPPYSPPSPVPLSSPPSTFSLPVRTARLSSKRTNTLSTTITTTPTPPIAPSVLASAAPVAVAIVQSKAAAAAAAAAAALEEPPKKRRRKRKRSDLDMPPTAVTLSRAELLKMSTEDLDRYEEQIRQTRELTNDEMQDIKRQRRLIKNRESAQQSRIRKKAQSDATENTLTDLAQENITLTAKLHQKEQEVAQLTQDNESLRAQLAELKAELSNSSWVSSWFSITPSPSPAPKGSQLNTVYLMIFLFSVAFLFDIKGTGIATRLTAPSMMTNISSGRILVSESASRHPAVTQTWILSSPSPSEGAVRGGKTEDKLGRSFGRSSTSVRSSVSSKPVTARSILDASERGYSMNNDVYEVLSEYSHLKIEGMTDSTAANSINSSESQTNQTMMHTSKEQSIDIDTTLHTNFSSATTTTTTTTTVVGSNLHQFNIQQNQQQIDSFTNKNNNNNIIIQSNQLLTNHQQDLLQNTNTKRNWAIESESETDGSLIQVN